MSNTTLADTHLDHKITLLAGVDKSRKGLSFAREYLKLVMRAGMHFQETKQWIQFWNSHPFFNQVAQSSPLLLKKIYRPYLTRQFNCSDRMKIITSHYDFIQKHKLSQLVLDAIDKPVLLYQFDGKSGVPYQLEIAAVNVMEREGELIFQLNTQGVLIYSLAFTFFQTESGYHIGVGCLQGGRAENTLEIIRKSTRDLFGLRPKTLLLKLVQQVGVQFKCNELLLVGNANRVVTQPMKKGKVIANYDESWLELKATRLSNGDFSLPCEQVDEPNYEEIPSSKRSEARKKFALFSKVSQSVLSVFENQN